MSDLTRRTALGLVLGMPLAGCSSLIKLGGPPPTLYRLSPKTTFDADLPRVDAQIVVEEPLASRGIDSDLIALAPNAIEIKYFAGSRWTDRAPRMVQNLLVQSFESTGRIVSVGRQAIGLRSDYNIVGDLRLFQASYVAGGPDNPPLVQVKLNIKLVRQPKQTIVASQTFEVDVQSAGTDMAAIVAAFDDALGKLLKRVVEWTLVTVKAQEKAA
jgi:cholesterol transport system auxiliary component